MSAYFEELLKDPDRLARIARTQPRKLFEAADILNEVMKQKDREYFEQSFEAFIMRAWQEIDPEPLDLNWHLAVIAEHLIDVMEGKIRNLIVNIPPRCGKTNTINVLWPSWVWCQPPDQWDYLSGPHVQFMCVSYAAQLSEEIAVKMRRLVTGEWYQGLWGDRVKIMPDQQSRANFGNSAGGARISASIEGGILGRGGDCVVGSTLVETDLGKRRVDSLLSLPGVRYVLSYDDKLETPTYRRVVAVARRKRSPIWRVHTRNGCVVEATGDHKVFTRRGWVQVLALVAGDVLLRCVPCGRAFEAEEDIVSLVERLGSDQDQEVFDIQVEGTECFFANGVLVHNCQIIDDPITPKEANSQVERERVMRDIKEGLPTRLNNPSRGARIMVMQRVHMDDPTSYALETWRPNVHLMFPMKFETRFPCPQDIRAQFSPADLAAMGRDSAEGVLLWPRRFGAKTVAAREFELGDFAFSAQFQQYPVPRSGGIISEDDWQIWPEDVVGVDDFRTYPGGLVTVPLPEVSHVVLVLDTAQSEKEQADFNACIVWGIWHRKRKAVSYQKPIRFGDYLVDPDEYTDDGEQPRAIMMGGWKMRAKLNDTGKDLAGNQIGLVQRVAATARAFRVDKILIEDKTRGLDVRNELIRQFGSQFRVELFQPRKHGDKVQRLHAVQPLFSQKLVYAPANAYLQRNPDGSQTVGIKEFAWVRAIVDEVAQVPRGAHDDYADAVSMGLLDLRDGGYLQLTREYLDEQIRGRVWKGRQETVREAYGV